MKVFIDTNVYLYYISENSDVPPLNELKTLVQDKNLILLVPEQLKQEYLRNTGKKINEVREKLKKIKETSPFRNIYKEIENKVKDCTVIVDKIREAEKEYEKQIQEKEVKVEKGMQTIDDLIQELFSIGKSLSENTDILQRAEIRYLKGNPPRKKNDSPSYGDAIIWECLLIEAIDDDLVIISKDSDYTEPDKEDIVINRLLKYEWMQITKKELKLMVSLSDFINKFEGEKVIDEKIIEMEKKDSLEPFYDTKYQKQAVQFPEEFSKGLQLLREALSHE